MKVLKKLLSVVLVFIICFSTVQGMCFSVFASGEIQTETVNENIDDDGSAEEYIYYSDLFYGYSYYLTNNYHIVSHRADSLEVTTNIINEYITTPNFNYSVISQGLTIATDPASIAKYFTDSIGLSSFKFNKELDVANQKFISAVCDVNLSASKSIGKENKYIKNINSFLKMCAELEKTAAENEAYYNGLEKPELYKTFIDMSFGYLKEYCTQISPKLPGLSSQIYTTLCESTQILGVLSDALEFSQALALSILMQETQMELITEIMSTQSSSSTLYKGMNRLKNQLSNGFVSYFSSTYIEDKVYDKVIGYLPELISKGILGNWASYGSVVTTVVKILNKAVFDWILDADYTEYTSAVMLTKYRDDLYEGLINKAEVFNVQFNNSEIEKFETLYNAYISVNAAAFEECKNLAEHNSDYDEEYCKTVAAVFDKENAYGEFVDGVKEYILAITPENRVITDYGTWEISSGSEVNLRGGSNIIDSNSVYICCEHINVFVVLNGYRYGTMIVNVPKEESITLNGSIRLDHHTKLVINGHFVVTGDLFGGSWWADGSTNHFLQNNGELSVRGTLSGIAIIQEVDTAVLHVGGNFSPITSSRYSQYNINAGTIVFDGVEEQEINSFTGYNIEVKNPMGIKYVGAISLYGEYNLNDHPLNNNGYFTRANSGCSFVGTCDYGRVIPSGDWTYSGYLQADVTDTAINVAKDVKLFLDGDCYSCVNNGEIIITGNVSNSIKNYGVAKIKGNFNGQINNYGDLSIEGDVYCSRWEGIVMNSDAAILRFGGDVSLFESGYLKISAGVVIYNGTALQKVADIKAPIIIIENASVEGVKFTSSISPSVLFDHRGNNFTLQGTYSKFVDYDGDGMKDNIDPEPTVGNPCVVYFESEDREKGTVSLNEIETVGGTKITVMATPTSKYDFSKWVNSAGEAVSTSAEYTFVAKGDDTYTAVFTKRQQPITVETTGGQIKVPSSAEIESEVSVSIIESAGYVFSDSSLKYNGNAIENGKFIMPDEPVVITAEFVRNENYFNLKEKLDEAKAYTYNDYSKESFAALTAAIKNAQDSLVNNILEEKSIEQITALQNAINNLQNKYITEIKFNNTPVLYYGVQEMINDISLSVIYDNGTKETITASQCSVSDYDSLLLGSQNITITYAEFTQTLEVTTQPRLISDCDVAGLTDKVFDGIKDDYTQELILTYSRTSDILVEGIDYRISYTDNSEIGTATVILEGIGNYSGQQTLTFEIYCEHNYVLDYTVDSTCSENGCSVYKCDICSGIQFFEYVVTENLPESPHNYSNNSDISYEFSCVGADRLELLFSVKTMTENNWDKIYIYNSEKILIGTYTGTQLTGQTVVVDGDKVRIRLTSDGSVVQYGFALDSITAFFSYVSLPLAEHDFSDWRTTKEATCTTTGEQKRSCIYCETEEYQVIDITEHTAGSEQTENLVEAKCEVNGSYDSIVYCVTCNKALNRESKILSATGHTPITVDGKAPTCAQTGLTDGKQCSACGVTIKAQQEIGITAHNPVVINEQVPQVGVPGYTGDTICEDCGELLEYGEVIEPLEPSNTCSHICHKTGFVSFFWKIALFFNRLFGTNSVCECGAAHY